MLRQMEAAFTDKDAIFKRALLLNSDMAADRISTAAAGNVDMNSAKFWKQVADLFNDVYTGGFRPARLNAIRDVLAKLVFELAAALGRALSAAVRTAPRGDCKRLGRLDGLADKPIVAQRFAGTPKQLERFLTAQLLKRSPQLALGKVKHAVRRTIDETLTARSGSRVPREQSPRINTSNGSFSSMMSWRIRSTHRKGPASL